MHRLLQKLGRKIVKKESWKKPGKRQFLWDTTEISELFEESNGTGTVLGISLGLGWNLQISKSAFDGMNNLQFLKVDTLTLCIPDGLNCLPDKLRYIFWNRCPLKFWPSKFSSKFLVELFMPNSSFETLWEGIKPLQCLKLMDLSNSRYLEKIPDLSKAKSLEKLDLHGCESLLELTSSIGNATKLTVCSLSGCRLLKKLPSSIYRLTNLEILNLGRCSRLKALSLFSSFEKLQLSDTAIVELPSSISTWSCLYELDMAGCTNISEFPTVPDSIVVLQLSETRIEEVPPWI